MSTLLVENIKHEDATGNALTFDANGNVTVVGDASIAGQTNIGAGTADSTSSLTVTGLNGVNGTLYLNPHSSKGSNVSHVHHGSTGDWYIRSANPAGKIIVQDSGGVVTIGTTTVDPDVRVNISGDVNADDYWMSDSHLPEVQPVFRLDPYHTDSAYFIRTNNDLVSYVDSAGQIAYTSGNNPRITHDPMTGEMLGILIESATDQYINDTDMLNGWSVGVSGDTFQASSLVKAPDGGKCALYNASSNNGIHRLHRSFNIPSGTDEYYVSCFFKRGNGTHNRYIEIEISGGFPVSGHRSVTFDLQDMVYNDTNGNGDAINVTMEQFPGGWVRCGYGFKNPGNTTGTVWFGMVKTFTSDIETTFDGTNNFFIWGANVTRHPNAGSSPQTHIRSYVPNINYPLANTTNSVTGESFRVSADLINRIFKYENVDFSFVIDFIYKGIPSNTTNYYLFQLSGDNGRYFGLRIDNGAGGALNFQHRLPDLSYVNHTVNPTPGVTKGDGTRIRVAGVISDGKWKAYSNGELILDATPNWASDLTEWQGLEIHGGGQPMGAGILRSLEFYDELLTDTQLQYMSNYRGY